MKRVYLAGPYNAPSIIESLDNMRRGMRMAVRILMAGYAPFTPWLDYHYRLMQREGEEVAREMYQAQSMAWLEVSDAMMVMPNSENSIGTQTEIARAKELGILVFYSIEELKEKIK